MRRPDPARPRGLLYAFRSDPGHGHSSLLSKKAFTAPAASMKPAALFSLLAGAKLLLMPAYHSTDFEVHRNWMALTHSLPLSRWYAEATSEWTLDYPPLFAWFERLLALGAPYFDAAMLQISAVPYASPPTVAYQRLTVVVVDALLGAWRLSRADASAAAALVAAPAALAFADAGLLIVDHVHFQYNGLLLGVLLLSVADVRAGRERRGAVGSAALLCAKHLFPAAPLYFCHLLQTHVRARRAAAPPSRASALGARRRRRRARLWPVRRARRRRRRPRRYRRPPLPVWPRPHPRVPGAERGRSTPLPTSSSPALAAAAPRRRRAAASSARRRRPCPHRRPGPLRCSSALLAPVLRRTLARPAAAAAFAPAVAYCGLAAFLCGYHVHEKALLPPPSSSPPTRRHPARRRAPPRAPPRAPLGGRPLRRPPPLGPAEYGVARALLLLYQCAALPALRARALPGGGGALLRWHEAAYLLGFAPLELLCAAVLPRLAPRLAFLPLLATSVYCAVGVHYAAYLAYRLWRVEVGE